MHEMFCWKCNIFLWQLDIFISVDLFSGENFFDEMVFAENFSDENVIRKRSDRRKIALSENDNRSKLKRLLFNSLFARCYLVCFIASIVYDIYRYFNDSCTRNSILFKRRWLMQIVVKFMKIVQRSVNRVCFEADSIPSPVQLTRNASKKWNQAYFVFRLLSHF